MDPSPPLKTYHPFWGKTTRETQTAAPYHLLVYHCLDAAAVAGVILAKNPHLMHRFTAVMGSQRDDLQEILQYSIALHDLGKFSGRFQSLSPETYARLNPGKPGKPYLQGIRHDAMGTVLISDALWEAVIDEEWIPFDRSDADEFDWQDIWDAWFQPISGHHGAPTQPLSASQISLSRLFTDDEKDAALDFAYDCYRLFFPVPQEKIAYSRVLLEDVRNASWLLAGLTILSDWIASGDMFAHCDEPLPLDVYWKEHAIPQAEAAVAAAGILPQTPSKPLGVRELFSYEVPSPVQACVETASFPDGPLLMVIEDQTGSGKTEAALVATSRLLSRGDVDGFFFALPTTATANSMYERMATAYRRLYADDARPWLVLSHGSRQQSPGFRKTVRIGPEGTASPPSGDTEYSPAECSAWIADNRKKSLLATVGVGTVDQALMAALPFRHQSLRLLGLATHVLIVDEVHSYDTYMHTILQNLLRFQAALGGSAILLSATLPLRMRTELVEAFCEGLGQKIASAPLRSMDYPLITVCAENGTQEITPDTTGGRTLSYTIRPLATEDEVHVVIQEQVDCGNCVCWVRNTVSDAIASYRAICTALDSDHVLLFHARYIAADRERIERDILSRFGKPFNPEGRRGIVVIATQVIEQSLDLDFDCVISDLAPIDSVIQRAGRMHRHNAFHQQDEIPELCVLMPDPTDVTDDWYEALFGHGAYVYPHHGQMWLTAKTLCEMGTICLPADARHLIESVYGADAQETIPEVLRQREIDALGTDFGDISIGLNNALPVFSGYTWKMNWMDETVTPTRLGDPVRSYVLVHWDGESLTPLAGMNHGAWEESILSVSIRKIGALPEYDEKLSSAIEAFRASLPYLGKWHEILPFIGENDEWRAEVYDNRRKSIVVRYSHVTGVEFCK